MTAPTSTMSSSPSIWRTAETAAAPSPLLLCADAVGIAEAIQVIDGYLQRILPQYSLVIERDGVLVAMAFTVVVRGTGDEMTRRQGQRRSMLADGLPPKLIARPWHEHMLVHEAKRSTTISGVASVA